MGQKEQKKSLPYSTIDFRNYSNKISNSGKDEKGGYTNGLAGDQTSSEWNIINWYSRPWNCVLRHPDKNVREKIAELSIKAAKNDKIGYDQNQRNTYWNELQKVNYDPSKITTPCQADCSAGIIANTRAVGYLFNIPALKSITATYTGNMRDGYKKAGFEILTDSKYLTNNLFLLPGDILLNDRSHVAVNLNIGLNTNNQQTTTTEKIGKNLTNIMTKDIQIMLNKIGDYKLAIDNSYGPATTAAVVDFQKKNGLKADGLVGRETIEKLQKQYAKIIMPPVTPKKELVLNTTGKINKQPIYKGKVTANILNVRTWAGTKYGNLTSIPTLKKDSIIQICDMVKGSQGGNWYYIRINNSIFGFASVNYIEVMK